MTEHGKKKVKEKVSENNELIIALTHGTNLYNGFDEEASCIRKAQVKAYIFPECENLGVKLKTEYRYLTAEGETRYVE